VGKYVSSPCRNFFHYFSPPPLFAAWA
jgi:hypothetical protein